MWRLSLAEAVDVLLEDALRRIISATVARGPTGRLRVLEVFETAHALIAVLKPRAGFARSERAGSVDEDTSRCDAF